MSKELFLKFLKCELEEEVTTTIKENNMDIEEHWKPYGDTECNFSIIGNQSSKAEKALTEKITNAVDSMLMRKCYEKGINPKGKDAPKSSKQALDELFNIKDGNSKNITKNQEKQISDEICIMATSKNVSTKKSKTELNIMIYDGGEGQTPNKLPSTILSLLKSNKSGIAFTQGSFNQGGSASLRYCGEKGYTLIISKRHPCIFENSLSEEDDDTKYKWGWTIIREELKNGYESPIYTYYAPNGNICTFECKTLPLKASNLKKPSNNKSVNLIEPYSKNVSYGTLIKMYNYKTNKKNNFVYQIKRELSKYIFDTYLPVKIMDCRNNNYSKVAIFRGLKKDLEDDLNKSENRRIINKKFPIVDIFKVDNQEIQVTLYALNEKIDENSSIYNFIEEMQPIILILGQQIQGTIDQRILSSSGLSAIKNSLLTIIEFPNINPKFKKDLFMTDRERLADKKPKKIILERLKNFYKDNEILKKFMSERLKNNINSTKEEDIKLIMEKLINKNSNIKNLLETGKLMEKESDRGNQINDDDKSNENDKNYGIINLKEIPTLFELWKKKKANIYKIEYNNSFKLIFKLDAKDDFFTRDENKGLVIIKRDNKKISNYSYTLSKGRMEIIFDKCVASKLGKCDLDVYIYCENSSEKCSSNLKIEVIESKSVRDKVIDITIPKYEEINLKSGIDGITDDTCVIIDLKDDGEIYRINMDNKYYKEKLKLFNDKQDKETYKEVYIVSSLISGMIAKEKALNQLKNNPDDQIEEIVEDLTEHNAKMLSIIYDLVK